MTGAPVWRFAERVSISEAKCGICNKLYQNPGGNTSNISGHILNVHGHTTQGKELEALKGVKIGKKKEREDKVAKLKDKQSIAKLFPTERRISAKAKESIDNALVEYVLACNETCSVVKNPFFRKLCFNLNKSYILFSRRELVRMVDAKAVEIKRNLIVEIQEDITSHKCVHITSDNGNSGDQN